MSNREWDDEQAAGERAMRSIEGGYEREIARLTRERDEARAERDGLARFKTYVHQRLDEAGVPKHPDGPHSKEGCRVGDRIDILLAEISKLIDVADAAREFRACADALAIARTDCDGPGISAALERRTDAIVQLWLKLAALDGDAGKEGT